ncbi:hypothetical protein EWM64_g559 [Hericium alpestre]|uniref:Major facilitator superfamily (MFS) profile domain-containing protein n=1 Tax=Hericium alpestre TaxID=135208 RepID=A0A4Z0ABP8_9AGAM|nr:hypothetical protein EWM64_g559 [Hericium alpestre]
MQAEQALSEVAPEDCGAEQVNDSPPAALPVSAGAKKEKHVEWNAAGHTVHMPPKYQGNGTADHPYVVDWDLGDPENPYNWSSTRKWLITSQMFGRRRIFLCTYSMYTLFHLGGALAHNIPTLLITRLLAGISGSAPLTNAGGAISDLFNARERGVASALYSTAPFLGPVTGPIVGGFVSENPHLGWRFTFWLMLILSAVNFFLESILIIYCQQYGPVLLRRRARKLEKESGGLMTYTTAYDLKRNMPFRELMWINLTRPFVFLFTEPIVTLMALYISVAYATLYAEFAAFPIVFQDHRGFSPGTGGLAFLGIGFGVVVGTALAPVQNRLYHRAIDRSEYGQAAPEERLYLAMMGGVSLPVGLFWFAWTTNPSIHWIVPILAGAPIGLAIAVILQCLNAYMMDAYTIYFASAISATVLLRSLFAAAFPLFSPVMFAALGDEWACSIFGFLALACMPVPFLFWKYGKYIRARSPFAWKEPDVTLLGDTVTSSEVATIREKEKIDYKEVA